MNYIALLRAVNVGGTGKLPMADLKAICEDIGLQDVQTYIASGNVVFSTNGAAAKVKAQLEERLCEYMGKPVGVLIRTHDEMAQVLASNPFPDAAGNRVAVTFLNAPPPVDTVQTVKNLRDEEIALGLHEIYIHYGSGMATSKLIVPSAKLGTARNINTVAKLVEMSAFRR
jgi:uncharacterized protein (DUF1697 family)